MPSHYSRLSDILEQQPRTTYQSFQNLFSGRSPLQQQYFNTQFTPTYNRYLGNLGSTLRSGVLPTTTFTDYLSGQFTPTNGLDPFTRRFGSIPPEMRGGSPGRRFNPQFRFIRDF